MGEINQDRLAKAMSSELLSGSHQPETGLMCVMEAVAYVAGEPWSDAPACTSPVIAAFLRSWNDTLPDEDRTRLLRPLIPRLIGTVGSRETELRRGWLSMDWLVRVFTPRWLREVPALAPHAEALASLHEIVDSATMDAALEPLRAARAAARDAAWDAAWDAARDAAWDAAWAAAWDAAWAKLAPIVAELQQSALELIDRMIACGAEEVRA